MLRARMTDDHRRCDELYARAEEAASRAEWETARPLALAFVEATRRHLDVEDQHLFPAFTKATGMTGGPIAVMGMEHEQMRELLTSLLEAAEARDGDAFLGIGETLVMVMQQHNFKEENILYGMLESRLGDASALLAKLED